MTIIKSTGGALSPSSSSPLNDQSDTFGESLWGRSTQADLSKLLGMPAVFIGDRKMGGIVVMLALLEALWSRGHLINPVVFIKLDGSDSNGRGGEGESGIRFGREKAEALREYVRWSRDHFVEVGKYTTSSEE
jgi:hypothetical protein